MSNNNNKHQGIVVAVAMIAAASLLTSGAVAAPAFAGGDDVKQKVEGVKAKCKQNFENVDSTLNTNVGPVMGACIALGLNVNDLTILSP